MEDKMLENNDEIEIDLKRLAGALLKKSWLIGIVSLICAVAVLIGTLLLVTPRYESSTMFYVNNNSLSLGDAAMSITSGDISASRGLVKSYIVILNSRESIMDVIDYAEVDRTYEELKGMITAEAVDSTEIFKVVVTSTDPQEAEKIASAIAYILPKRISSIIEGTSAKIVDSAVVASRPSSPSYSRNTVLGFLGGFVLSAGMIVLLVLLDKTIRTEDDVAQCCKYPVLVSVPDMADAEKHGYGYSYDRDRKKSMPLGFGKKPEILGSGINFAAAEAYKLLRTKLQFSFADESASHVIGVSSALSGEGKSVTAVNLAYSLSQLGKKVILIDCDMRRPTLAEKLNIQKHPGLSDFLTGQCGLENLVQFCGLKGNKNAFHVITAGQNPPNPIELLSSARMEKLLLGLRDICDYVILDLPPVVEVSDALVLAANADGFLLVVRQDRCNRQGLMDTVRQFEFVDARILGAVFNCTKDSSGKKYYRKYYGKPGQSPGKPAQKRTDKK